MASNANRTYADATYEANGQISTFQVVTDDIDNGETRELSIFDQSTINVGRRGVLHQYAYFDIPFFEDMGRKARNITVEANFIGDDHVLRTNDFIGMVEADGVGTLNHPQLDFPISVVPLDVKLTYRDNNIGITEVSISFIEAGEYLAPSTPVQEDLSGLPLEFLNGFVIDSNNQFISSDEGFREAILERPELNEWIQLLIDTDPNIQTSDGGFSSVALDPIDRERAFRAFTDYFNGDGDASIHDVRVDSLINRITLGDAPTDFQAGAQIIAAFLSRNQEVFNRTLRDGNTPDPNQITRDFQLIDDIIDNIQTSDPVEIQNLELLRTDLQRSFRFQIENVIQGPPTANFIAPLEPSPIPTYLDIYPGPLGAIRRYLSRGDDPLFSVWGYTID